MSINGRNIRLITTRLLPRSGSAWGWVKASSAPRRRGGARSLLLKKDLREPLRPPRLRGENLLLEFLDVRALRRLEVEERVRQALIDLGVGEHDLVHVALRVRDDARQHLAVLANDEDELRNACHRLDRI